MVEAAQRYSNSELDVLSKLEKEVNKILAIG